MRTAPKREAVASSLWAAGGPLAATSADRAAGSLRAVTVAGIQPVLWAGSGRDAAERVVTVAAW